MPLWISDSETPWFGMWLHSVHCLGLGSTDRFRCDEISASVLPGPSGSPPERAPSSHADLDYSPRVLVPGRQLDNLAGRLFEGKVKTDAGLQGYDSGVWTTGLQVIWLGKLPGMGGTHVSPQETQ
jgi:hypothetical protein